MEKLPVEIVRQIVSYVHELDWQPEFRPLKEPLGIESLSMVSFRFRTIAAEYAGSCLRVNPAPPWELLTTEDEKYKKYEKNGRLVKHLILDLSTFRDKTLIPRPELFDRWESYPKPNLEVFMAPFSRLESVALLQLGNFDWERIIYALGFMATSLRYLKKLALTIRARSFYDSAQRDYVHAGNAWRGWNVLSEQVLWRLESLKIDLEAKDASAPLPPDHGRIATATIDGMRYIRPALAYVSRLHLGIYKQLEDAINSKRSDGDKLDIGCLLSDSKRNRLILSRAGKRSFTQLPIRGESFHLIAYLTISMTDDEASNILELIAGFVNLIELDIIIVPNRLIDIYDPFEDVMGEYFSVLASNVLPLESTSLRYYQNDCERTRLIVTEYCVERNPGEPVRCHKVWREEGPWSQELADVSIKDSDLQHSEGQ